MFGYLSSHYKGDSCACFVHFSFHSLFLSLSFHFHVFFQLSFHSGSHVRALTYLMYELHTHKTKWRRKFNALKIKGHVISFYHHSHEPNVVVIGLNFSIIPNDTQVLVLSSLFNLWCRCGKRTIFFRSVRPLVRFHSFCFIAHRSIDVRVSIIFSPFEVEFTAIRSHYESRIRTNATKDQQRNTKGDKVKNGSEKWGNCVIEVR